jgi:xre family toxin-antitoxin system, antitoxin component
MESNLSREEYAKKVGFERTNLSRLESGKKNPSLSTLIELAHKNGYEVDIQLIPQNY